MESISSYYKFDKANLCSLVNTGVPLNEAVTLDPKSLYRVGGICFKDFEHACDYYGVDKNTITEALKDASASKFDTFMKLGKSPKLAAFG